MLKIRLQGTKKDIQWFRQLMVRHQEIEVLQVSDLFSNKGTNKYFRAYSDLEKKKR